MAKLSTVFYHSWFDAWEELSDAEVGELCRAIVEYDKTGTAPTFNDRFMKSLFATVKPIIEDNKEKYTKTVEQRKEAGRKSGQARRAKAVLNENEQMLNSFNENEQSRTKRTVNDNVNVNVNDNVNTNVLTPRKYEIPTLKEVQGYFKLKGATEKEADDFFNLNEKQNWMLNGGTIMYWRAFADKFIDRGKKRSKYINYEQRDYSYTSIEDDLLKR